MTRYMPLDLRALAALAFLCAAGPAAAQDTRLGLFDDWNAFEFTEGGKKVCYMSSTPLDMEPKNVNRGDVYIQVTHDNRDGSRNVVSIIAGYTYAEGKAVVAAVGPDEFRMFTAADAAWNLTPEDDAAMVAKMIAGSRLTVLGESSRGTQTRDIYSLLGFTAAHKAIDEACGA
ncbi:MAG: invasion associated locus B family protein [Proteobacteria bacterium]|nr:invasion associated locus B family protein [Pseudomonadota bacterium]